MLTPGELKVLESVNDSDSITIEQIGLLFNRLGVMITDDDVFPMATHFFYYQPHFISTQGWQFKDIAYKIHHGWEALNSINPESTELEVYNLCTGLTEKPYRLHIFKEIMARMYPHTPGYAGSLLLKIWTQTEVSTQHQVHEFVSVFKRYKALLRHTLSDMPVQAHYELYHGVEFRDRGYQPRAWTLNIETAEFYARRFNALGGSFTNRQLLTVNISHAQLLTNALFYTNDRKESEVFFLEDPRSINDTKSEGTREG